MLDSQQNDKIFRFDDDSQSQTEQISTIVNKNNFHHQQNPEKNRINDRTYKSIKFQSKTSQNFELKQPNQKLFQTQPLRRNRSFKVKKSNQNQNLSKIVINKSVVKFDNIFKQAQQISVQNDKRWAVHQEKSFPNDKAQVAVKYKKFKSNQKNLIKNYQPKSILKLSGTNQNKYLKQKLQDQNEISASNKKSLLFRKTAYTQNSMSQLLQRKLSSRANDRMNDRKIKTEVKVKINADQIKDWSNFIHEKIPNISLFVTKVTRNTSGLNFIWPQYHMHDHDTNVHILSAKKKAANTTSNYYISRNQKQIDVQNENYMGKVRSNFLGSCFNIFNQGLNPQNTTKDNKNVRKLLASVIYESQIANANPKTMRIYMIKPPYSYYDLEGTNPKQQETNLQDLYEMGENKQRIFLFKNRKAIYNKKENKFVLNFQGRIKRPSTKNFILEDHQTKKEVLMFGKTNQEQFVLYASSPLSPHIAMGIALAQLDNKIICD